MSLRVRLDDRLPELRFKQRGVHRFQQRLLRVELGEPIGGGDSAERLREQGEQGLPLRLGNEVAVAPYDRHREVHLGIGTQAGIRQRPHVMGRYTNVADLNHAGQRHLVVVRRSTETRLRKRGL
ncbi:hypothetical protein [Luteibacter sp. UNCMF366Tsu5.1]|uniref:hypothetical protein n=1 Tax=Luteibacter sp. UNCMF366Tsu5.1 TaxID=1502758 RepID=UPI00116093ED|nr:hypothetical protein [Luteibacter sp. UNCMF366Tsu5.1]